MALSQLNTLTSPVDDRHLRALQTALADLSPTQIAWVSGYLAGISGVGASVAEEAESAGRLTILYGSQTGNARSVAELLGERAKESGLEAQAISMGDYNPRKLAGERWVLLVVSTHGEGEPPESAYGLHAFLHSKRAPRLEQLHYAVLGLGDSSYEQFCRAAADFDARLAELGGQRLMPRRCCDVDYQADAKLWSVTALDKVTDLTSKRQADVVTLPGVRLDHTPSPGKDNPYATTLHENRQVTSDDAVGDVRHLVLATDPRVLRYSPGDSLGVWFRNDPSLADAVLAAVKVGGETPISLGGQTLGLREALIERLELTQLHPAVVRGWSELAGADALKGLAADDARLRAYARARQFIDLLAEYPARPDADVLASLLQPLQPRLYSIASSQAEFEDEVHIAVSVVQYHAHGRDHLGGASGFLAKRLAEDEALDVYVAESPAFRLPEDGNTPLIMIGAGTGVAPYRAFLQQRAANGDKGPSWLVFGNRHFHRDFLYQLDWQAQRKAGLLTRVSLAFSRDSAEKVYVQHRLQEQSAELYRWLQDGAHVYVCGATAMGQGVHRALLDAVTREAGLTEAATQEYIENLRREGRYHRDLY